MIDTLRNREYLFVTFFCLSIIVVLIVGSLHRKVDQQMIKISEKVTEAEYLVCFKKFLKKIGK